MNRDQPQLSACLDSNVLISAIAFGGTPLKVMERALERDFQIVTSLHIFEEVRRNLTGKLGLSSRYVDRSLDDLLKVSSVFVPSGKLKFIEHEADNLVLEVALMGWANVLVTGDRKHLLPISRFGDLIIEPPSKLLARLDCLSKA